MTHDEKNQPVGGDGKAGEAGQAEAVAEAMAEADKARAEADKARAEADKARAEADKARAEADKARAEAAENWDRFLRTRAEFDNYQKRVQRDLAASIRRGKKDMLLKLLDVVDNLTRALEAWKSDEGSAQDPHLSGIEIIHRQLLGVLSTEGVVPIEAVGTAFDPNFHEAVAVWEKDGLNTEIVTDEIQRGYTYEGEVLRAARVRVAKPTG